MDGCRHSIYFSWLFSCRDVGLHHLARIDDAVELLFRDETEFKGRQLSG